MSSARRALAALDADMTALLVVELTAEIVTKAHASLRRHPRATTVTIPPCRLAALEGATGAAAPWPSAPVRPPDSGLHPVLDLQAGNSAEFFDVVRNQTHVQAQGVGRDQQVHRADRLALPLKRRPQPAVGGRCWSIKWRYFERSYELVEGFSIPRPGDRSC